MIVCPTQHGDHVSGSYFPCPPIRFHEDSRTMNRMRRIHRLNLKTGGLVLDTENPGDVAGWAADPKFQVRAAQIQTPDGGTEIRIREDVKSPWKSELEIGAQITEGI